MRRRHASAGAPIGRQQWHASAFPLPPWMGRAVQSVIELLPPVEPTDPILRSFDDKSTTALRMQPWRRSGFTDRTSPAKPKNSGCVFLIVSTKSHGDAMPVIG